MKTDDLITLLATGVAPVPTHPARNRFATALLLGGVGALLIVAVNYGFRSDMAQALHLAMFWVKLAFPLSLAGFALVLTHRLAHPGVKAGAAWVGLVVSVVVMAALALLALWSAPAPERAALVLGRSWTTCVFNIAWISAPLFVAVLWAMKGLAPTRLALAGACAGLLASSAAAAVYALHCPEMDAPFLAVWYTLGMLAPAALGAWVGPRVLRW